MLGAPWIEAAEESEEEPEEISEESSDSSIDSPLAGSDGFADSPESPISRQQRSTITVVESKADLVSYLLLDPPNYKTFKRWLGFGLNFKYYNYLREIDPTQTHLTKETWYKALAWLQRVESDVSKRPHKGYRAYVKANVGAAVPNNRSKMQLEEGNLKYYQILGSVIFHWYQDLCKFEHDLLDDFEKAAWPQAFLDWNREQSALQLPDAFQVLDLQASDLPPGLRSNRPKHKRENDLEIYNRLFWQYWFFENKVCSEDRWANFWVDEPNDCVILEGLRTLPWHGEPRESNEETDTPAETWGTWWGDIRAGVGDRCKPKDYVDCPCKVSFIVDSVAEEQHIERRFSDAIASGKGTTRNLRLNRLLACKHPGISRDLGRWRQSIRDQANLSDYYFDFNRISMKCYTQPPTFQTDPADICIILQKGFPMSYDNLLDRLALHDNIVEIHFEVMLKSVEQVADESCYFTVEEFEYFEFDENGDPIWEAHDLQAAQAAKAMIAKKLAAIDCS